MNHDAGKDWTLLDKGTTVCCPQCHNETLMVRIEEGGKCETEFGAAYWYRGQGKCSHCGWEGQHEDQSI